MSPGLRFLLHGPSHDIRAASRKAHESNPHRGLSTFQTEQCPGHWHFCRYQKKNQNRTRQMDPILPEPPPARFQGAPGDGSKPGPRCPLLRLPPPHLRGCVRLSSTALVLKQPRTQSCSDSGSKCSAPLIRTPGAHRAGDIGKNTPST